MLLLLLAMGKFTFFRFRFYFRNNVFVFESAAPPAISDRYGSVPPAVADNGYGAPPPPVVHDGYSRPPPAVSGGYESAPKDVTAIYAGIGRSTDSVNRRATAAGYDSPSSLLKK